MINNEIIVMDNNSVSFRSMQKGDRILSLELYNRTTIEFLITPENDLGYRYCGFAYDAIDKAKDLMLQNGASRKTVRKKLHLLDGGFDGTFRPNFRRLREGFLQPRILCKNYYKVDDNGRRVVF